VPAGGALTRLPILGRPMVNAAACAACGGACCKNYPGHAGPEDFPDLGRLEALLVAGRWTLDEWIGDPLWKVLSRRRRRHGTPAPRYVARVLLPRPAIRGHEGKPYHAPGACRTGCRSRPTSPRPARAGSCSCRPSTKARNLERGATARSSPCARTRPPQSWCPSAGRAVPPQRCPPRTASCDTATAGHAP